MRYQVKIIRLSREHDDMLHLVFNCVYDARIVVRQFFRGAEDDETFVALVNGNVIPAKGKGKYDLIAWLDDNSFVDLANEG